MIVPQNQWRKSSYSSHTGDDCVEVAPLPGATAIRDTKARRQGALAVSAASWRIFLDGVRKA